MTNIVVCILYNAEALRGDGAGAFNSYAVHKCYLWEGLARGRCDFSILLVAVVGCVVLLTVTCCIL